MNRNQLLHDLKLATADLAAARRKLDEARFLARNGMANNLGFAAMVEGTTYHHWLLASLAFSGTR